MAKYSNVFQDLSNLIGNSMDPNIKDALIHEFIINNGIEEHARKSFIAVTAQIRVEMNSKNLKPIYTDIFRVYPWCKRILEGKAI